MQKLAGNSGTPLKEQNFVAAYLYVVISGFPVEVHFFQL
jgi:hypothetical protein